MPKAFPKSSAFKRVIALCIASILLHLVALDWATGHVRSLDARQDNTPPIMVRLQAMAVPVALTAPVMQQSAANAAPALSKPARKRRPRPDAMTAAPSARPAIDSATAAPGRDEEAQAAPADPPAPPLAQTSPAPPSETTPTPSEATPEPPAEPAKTVAELPGATPVPRYKVSPPPSAELKYEVIGLRSGKTVYGSAKILWQYAGDSYSLKGETSVLFFTLLSFSSEGSIDGFGVAPLLYAEKRMRKSETNTHFHRERNTISFSASTLSYPRQGGEQDRASILWQLAGIARGDSAKFVAGGEIDVFVAGVRDGEIWRIQVIGEEQIALGRETIHAWHVQRQPRPGSYEQTLDIWLAPRQEWYPVRIAYTEANGDKLDMSLSKLDILKPPP